MQIIYRFFLIQVFAVFCTVSACAQQLVDKNATRKTKALYQNLKKISDGSFLFGHQDTDAYGTSWRGQAQRSDVKDICGRHAAIHGWDLGNENEKNNLDSVPFADMRKYIRMTYKRGGINTISWHLDNPVTGSDSWNTEPVVSDIIPGGKHHAAYVRKLDRVAQFIKSLRAGFTRIPIVFRPFHEHNGDWFWWGKGNCSEADYIELYRFTVNYLIHEKKLRNVIFAYSPDRSRMNVADLRNDYLYGYPGDDYVDILGLDNYMDVGVKWNTKPADEQREEFIKALSTVSTLAKEKNKVAALTETGLEGVTNPNWFTEVILNPLKENRDIDLAYILVWRNADTKHHYAPYKGHPAEIDFMKFFHDPLTLFEGDFRAIYRSRSNKPGTILIQPDCSNTSSIKK